MAQKTEPESRENGSTPLLSIIMPVYNVERYLEQAVESVKAQTMTDWELIMIDDGSTDGSGLIADRMADDDNRIKVIHQQNLGVSAARNRGLREASGELIGFVDSDDYLEPDMYAAMTDAMRENGADVVQCGYWFEWRNRSKEMRPGYDATVVSHDEAMKELLLNRKTESYLWDKLFRRKIMTVDMPLGVEYCEDLKVMYRWMDNAGSMAVVERPLYHYRMRRSSAVNQRSALPRIGRLKIEIERAGYYRNRHINEIDNGVTAATVVSAAIGAAKYIARNCNRETAIEAFKEIVRLSSPWFKTACRHRSATPRQEKRFRRLMTSPEWFRITMLAARLLQPSRLRKESDRFA